MAAPMSLSELASASVFDLFDLIRPLIAEEVSKSALAERQAAAAARRAAAIPASFSAAAATDPVVAGAVSALVEIKANPKTKTDPFVAFQLAARKLKEAQEEFYAAVTASAAATEGERMFVAAGVLNITFTKVEHFEDDPHPLDAAPAPADPFAGIDKLPSYVPHFTAKQMANIEEVIRKCDKIIAARDAAARGN
jgi:hypothetical protein